MSSACSVPLAAAGILMRLRRCRGFFSSSLPSPTASMAASIYPRAIQSAFRNFHGDWR